MPRFNLLLFIYCIVTLWIFGDAATDGNATNETKTSYVDDTRREEVSTLGLKMDTEPTTEKVKREQSPTETSTATVPYVLDLKMDTKSTTQKVKREHSPTETLTSTVTYGLDRIDTETTTEKVKREQSPKETLIARMPYGTGEEITGLEPDVPCDKTQFLLKILTVLLPLLRDEVPARSRTSYILYILKDLLKSSPESAQDYEVMNKINDLLATLEKYHDKNLDLENINALRQIGTGDDPKGLKSKISFKYEVPQLTNPACTAELLTVMKTVQQAILRLVNNPLCKSHVSAKLSILDDVEQYFKNPNLYSYDTDVAKPRLPEKYPILDTDVSKVLMPGIEDTIYPFTSESLATENNFHDKSPYHQKLPFHPIDTEGKPFYIYPQYPYNKDSIYSHYQNDDSLDILSTITSTPITPIDFKFPTVEQDMYTETISPYNNFRLEDDVFQNPTSISLPLASKDAPVKVQFDNISPYLDHEFDLPSKQYDKSLEIYGDRNSAEFEVNSFKQTIKKPSVFDVDGSPNSAYISLNQYPSSSDDYIMPFDQNPIKNSYNTSPQNLPTERGVPDIPSNRPELNPYLPNDQANQGPSKLSPLSSYLPVFNDNPEELPIVEWTEKINTTEPPVDELEYQHDYYRYPPIKKGKPIHLPITYWPTKYDNYVHPAKPNSISVSAQVDDHAVISVTTMRPLRPDVDNQFKISEITIPYEKYSYTDDSSPYTHVPEINEQKLWNPINVPSKILPQPRLVPENNILLIIKDNIDAMERKIPKEKLDAELREMIRKLKHLINLEKITVEEYVNIINKYQVLIKYIKQLNISNAIMKEPLLSMTNLDKLDLLAGKSQVIELTYLVKRPKPLVYQPYYYVKYQLPYTSFLPQLERLLSLNPYLKDNPSKLYKALISRSKIAETSPDLEKYGKEDILRLTFNKGTLAGRKVIKGSEIDMYETLDRLKHINSDLTVEDVYQLIKNLDAQLKFTPDGLVLENRDIPDFNIRSNPDKIRINKVKKRPLLHKITTVTTNKVAADNILEEILKYKVNDLRSNISEFENSTERKNIVSESDTHKSKDDAQNKRLIARIKDTYNLNKLYNNVLPTESTKYDIKTNSEKYLSDNIKIIKDSNYYAENNPANAYKLNSKSDDGLDWTNQYSNPRKYDKKLSLPKQVAWWDTTINAYDEKPMSKSQSVDFDSNLIKSNKIVSYLADDLPLVDSGITSIQQLHPIVATKLLDASLKVDNNYVPQKYRFKSTPGEIIGSSNVKSHLLRHSKSYINRIPVEHSKIYLVEKPKSKIVNEFQTTYTDPVKYNVEHSQSFIDYNPYVANYNYNIKPSQKHTNLAKHTVESQTVAKENLYKNYYDYINKIKTTEPSKYQNMNLQQSYINTNPYGKHFNIVRNVGNFGVYPQNVYPNHLVNTGYQNMIHHRLPLAYQLNRRPRQFTRPFFG